MNHNIRTFIVDDERRAREGIRSLLERESDVEVVGEYGIGRDAARAVASLKPDLLLLDIQMTDLDGFACLDEIEAEVQPVVVFVTAYEEFAVKAFEARAADYVLKPFSDDRFAAAIATARQTLAQRRTMAVGSAVLNALSESDGVTSSPKHLSRIMIRSGSGWKLFPLASVHWIEGADYYARVHTAQGPHITRESLQRLSQMLDPRTFVRVHKSAIVNVDHIEEIQPLTQGRLTLVLRGGARIPMSRRRRQDLEAALGHDL